MNISILFKVAELVKAVLSPSELPTLLKIQQMYADQLLPNTYTYSISEPGHKPKNIKLEFSKGNFCHLFSIASIVKDVTPDTDAFSGIQGWNNIENGRINFKMLRQLNNQQFSYYQDEYNLASKLMETVENPEIVAWDPSKVPGSHLECEYILFKVAGAKTIHLGIDRGSDGVYFPRSYFVRDVSKDKAYPTKYIANMKHYKVKVKKEPRKSKER